MSDIVERLRACHGIQSGDPECCCEDAAAEIERLKAALNEIWIDAGFQDTAGAYRICGIAKAALEPIRR
jgi:hypothetical protein